MIEKPNISDERVIFALRENYSIQVIGVEFLPLGLDAASWSYRVKTENDTYFLKIRKGMPNPAGILIPRFLKERGIEQVMAPLSSSKGNVWEKVDDFYFILYPFIKGGQVMDIGMSDAHWIEFGSVLKRLHTIKLPADISSQIRRENFIPNMVKRTQEIHAQVKARKYDDPFQKELAEFWLENYSTISIILERTEALAKKMRNTDMEFVLCHADIHIANVLRTEDDKIFIVDWDETMFAPKERDLLFVMGSVFGDTSSGRVEQLIFKGYGEIKVDPLALAYYRYDWCVEDIGEFAKQIFTEENIGEKTKIDSIWWIKKLFAHGSSVETALNTQIEI